MVGPQNDLSTEIYSLLNYLLKNCTNSWASASILGKSVCPPSHGRTMVSLWFLIVAGQSIELPNPVPGPMTPLILLGLGWTSLIGTKFSSGTSKIPYEAAQKSLMNLKCGIFRLVPSYSPDNVFHFSTLARETVLSKIGPAIPMLATSGQCSTPARNFSMADWKTSQSATASVSFLRVASGVFLVVSTLTNYRRMLVPPTSPSNAYLSTSDISIKYLFYQSTSQLKIAVLVGLEYDGEGGCGIILQRFAGCIRTRPQGSY